MIRMGKRKKEGELEGALVYLGIVGGVVVYNLLKPGPGVTRAAEMPSTVPPAEFNSLPEVAARFDEVKTLYRSGVLGFQQTRDQVTGLIDAAFRLETQGKAQAAPVADLVEAMAEFHDDTQRAEQEIAQTNVVPA